MKYSKLLIILVLLTIGITEVSAQSRGEIAGKIIDSVTGDEIIGANILIEGTNIGAATDLEGRFKITNVEPGSYNLLISYISYAKTELRGVQIESGKTTNIEATLIPEAISVDEIVVIDRMDLSYESALLNQKKKSTNISDGISAEQIKRSPDATTGDALKRVTGVTLIDNKFIFVRGTSERYSNAQLNNTSLASSEPEKKSFAFDLLPSNLLENTVILKSFTPDLAGDFAGGTVQVNTIDFPDKLKLNVSYGTSYTSNSSLKSFNTYSGGGNDFWGVDDGSRKIPSSFPTNVNNAGLDREEINSLAREFNNVWQTTSRKAPLNNNFSISFGDGASLLGQNFGFITALSFRNSFKTENIERNEFESSGEPRFEYSGTQSTYSTLWGGLFNFSYKVSDLHKISIKNTYSHSSDDETSVLTGAQYSDAGKDQIQSALRYVEREVYSGQLVGEHAFPIINNMKFEWKAFTSYSRRDEPDYRRIMYARDIGSNDPFAANLGFQPNLKNGGRFFSHLTDRTKGAAVDFTLPVSSLKFKYGALYEEKKRSFDSRLISVIINASGNGFTDFNLLYLPLDKIFEPENFKRNGFSIGEYQNGTNTYKAGQEMFASYLMGEVPFSLFNQDFIFIAGARLENSTQTINSLDLSGLLPIYNELKKADILPSVNLIYKLNEQTNVRLAYSQTVNRPELRELAPFSYFDFATQTSQTGNPGLQRALIRNYDFRYEIYPSVGELLSISTFYKNFSNAIEKVVVAGVALGSERTFLNSDKATIYGFELEGRLSLRHIGSSLENFSVNGNYSWIKSNVEVKGSETTIARDNRPLQGQSPYVINLGILFIEPSFGTSVNLLYNRIGERIIEVSTAYEEDIIEEPRDVVDLVITQPLFTNFELKFAIRDILSEEQVFRQGDKKSRINSRESNISLGFSFKL